MRERSREEEDGGAGVLAKRLCEAPAMASKGAAVARLEFLEGAALASHLLADVVLPRPPHGRLVGGGDHEVLSLFR